MVQYTFFVGNNSKVIIQSNNSKHHQGHGVYVFEGIEARLDKASLAKLTQFYTIKRNTSGSRLKTNFYKVLQLDKENKDKFC